VIREMQGNPDQTDPQMFVGAEVEGFYRLVRNEDVTPEALLAPHYALMKERTSMSDFVVAVHDTTEICHGRGSPGTDFYDLENGRFGYLAHVCLVIEGASRTPLGIGHYQQVERDLNRVRPTNSTERWNREDKESLRWLEGVRAVSAGVPAVHVADREADSYENLVYLLAEGHRFVIRAKARRRTTLRRGQTALVGEVLSGAPVLLAREVKLSKRVAKNQGRNSHPPREARTATLEVSAQVVELRRPKNLRGTGEKALPPRLMIRAVRVREVGAPEDADPVEWILYTSEPIETSNDLAHVVDCYCKRWMIEELFKALKSGCAFEKRQFESRKTSQAALALSLQVAFRLLLIRALDRSQPTAPASAVLDREALRLLRAIAARPLPPRATAHDVLMAIAALGGHLKSNGAPGWMVLGRGMAVLEDALRGWRAARPVGARSSRCDQ
jgi:hypothetical protein